MTDQNTPQTLSGIIARVCDPKTIVVEVRTQKRHARYQKLYKRSKRFHVHVGASEKLAEGQQVSIVPDRPRSARKHWRLA